MSRVPSARVARSFLAVALAAPTLAAAALAVAALPKPLVERSAPPMNPGAATDDEVQGALAALASPDAGARAAASGWLARHLAPRDLGAVAAALRDGGPGVRDALVRVLASEDGVFGLAALVASDLDPAVAPHGQAALIAQAGRWSRALLTPPLPEGDVPPDVGLDPQGREALAAADARERDVRVRTDRGSLADLVDRLDRLAGAPVPLVLDPALYPGVRRGVVEVARPTAVLTVPWLELVRGEALRQKLALRVHGEAPYDLRALDDGGGAPEGTRIDEALGFLRDAQPDTREASAPFLWLGLRGRGAESPGAERLAAWVTTVAAEGGDPALREASARALASTRWPVAALWLADRWLASGDPAALEGTLAALARGLVAPRVATPAVVRTLLAEVDRRLAANQSGSQRFAERVARALAAFPAVDAAGAPLGPVVLEGLAGADPVGAWARLVALEGHGRAQPGATDEVRRLLADAATPAPLLVQAALTWRVVAAPGAEPPVVARPEALFVAAAEAGLAEAVGRALAAARARCAYSALDTLVEGGLAVGPLAAAWHHVAAVAGEADLAPFVPVLAATLADPSGRERLATVARLTHETGRFTGGDPAAFVALARQSFEAGAAAEAARLARRADAWVLDAGLATAAEREALAAAAHDPATPAQARLALLAGLVADAAFGSAAQEALGALVAARIEAEDEGTAGPSDPPLAEVVLALTRAGRRLAAARLDVEAEALFGRLRGAAGRAWPGLAEVLYDSDWPPLPEPEPRDVDARERRYGR